MVGVSCLSGLFHAVCAVYTVHSVQQGGTCCVDNKAIVTSCPKREEYSSLIT